MHFPFESECAISDNTALLNKYISYKHVLDKVKKEEVSM
jgi:hypothetical protein